MAIQDLSNEQLLALRQPKGVSNLSNEELLAMRPEQPKEPVKENLLQRFSPAITGFAQGATFGLADEIAGALDPTKTAEDFRTFTEEQREKSPTQSVVGDIAGGLTSGGVLGKGILAGAKGLGLGAKALRGAGTGAGIGAFEGFTRGEGLEDRLKGARDVGTVSGVAGALLPVAGAGLGKVGKFVSSGARAKEITKGRGSILNVAKNRDATEETIKAFRSSGKLSKEFEPQVKEALINTEDRTRKLLNRGLGAKNIKTGFQNVKDEFASTLDKKGLKAVTKNDFNRINTQDETGDLFRKSMKLARRGNPKLSGLPDDSIRVMQDTKSILGQIERKGGVDSVVARQVKREIGDSIESKISGFKDLTTKYAKTLQADDLLEDINNLRGNEISDFAKKLTTSQSKKKITGLVGEEKGKLLVGALRKESDRFDNLKKLNKAIVTGEKSFADRILENPLASGRALKDVLEGGVQAGTGKKILRNTPVKSLRKPSQLQTITGLQALEGE